MKILSWNIGKYKGSEKDSMTLILKGKSVKKKLTVLEDLLKCEEPDIFCVVEGTIKKEDNRLQNVFTLNNYTAYFEPNMINNPKYKGYFEFDNFERYALKIFVKNTFLKNLLPLDPSRVTQKGRCINLELIKNKGVIIFLHRNMSTKKIDQHNFMKTIHDWCFLGNLGRTANNLIILGDFNLLPWNSDYFGNNSGYLESEFIESIYEMKARNSSCFFNPIFNYMSQNPTTNLGGTFYSKNHGWGIYDFTLIRDYDKNNHDFEIITKTKSYSLLDSTNTKINGFFNHEFDHLPIKIKIKGII